MKADQKAIDDDAAEEAAKSTPEGKAAKWITTLSKDLVEMKILVKDGKKADHVPAAKRNLVMKLPVVEVKSLADLREHLETSQRQDALSTALMQADEIVKQSKHQVKTWK